MSDSWNVNISEPKKRKLHDVLVELPSGQRRVAWVLVSEVRAPTYREVARGLDLSVGTVHRHLKRIRDDRPDVYRAIMLERRRQLAERHAEAIRRAQQRSRRYFRRRANWRYFERYGYWPWERFD